jgi:hypothetical protein
MCGFVTAACCLAVFKGGHGPQREYSFTKGGASLVVPSSSLWAEGCDLEIPAENEATENLGYNTSDVWELNFEVRKSSLYYAAGDNKIHYTF